jgi:hypothetical protein
LGTGCLGRRCVFGCCYLWVHVRRHYTPPVVFVEGKRAGGNGLQGVN